MKKEVTLNNNESDPPTQQNNIPEDIPVPTQQNNNASEEVLSPTPQNNSVPGDVPGCSKVYKPLDNKSEQKLNNSLFSEIESSTKIQKRTSITANLPCEKGITLKTSHFYRNIYLQRLLVLIVQNVAVLN